MHPILETERLCLRELIAEDADSLAIILCDAQSMRYYPAPFSMGKVRQWIDWNIDNYRRYKHGLWAVIRKEDSAFLGDCGITVQDIEGQMLPELGYHIRKDCCNLGYATEAARACIGHAFNSLGLETLYTYTRFDNAPSIRVAEKNGFHFVKHFEKIVMGERVKEALYCLER